MTAFPTAGAASSFPVGGTLLAITPDVTATFRAMASDINVRIVGPRAKAPESVALAEDVFRRVERACTRFDPSSALMLANAGPDQWHSVPVELYEALAEAAAAHVVTDGLFDPRVLRVLESYGYDRSLPFEEGPVEVGSATPKGRHSRTSTVRISAALRGVWNPSFDEPSLPVWLGSEPIDLGGIGKGLAVRWAMEELAGAGVSVLLEAGGDCSVVGAGPDGDGWKVGVQDPREGDDPVAVLALTDRACATSSIRVRRWRSNGRDVHHLIDPRTGAPGGTGLAAVTVVDQDPALAEVWSKSLFLAGADGIEALADHRGLAALWVTEEGSLGLSAAMHPFVIWRYDGVC